MPVTITVAVAAVVAVVLVVCVVLLWRSTPRQKLSEAEQAEAEKVEHVFSGPDEPLF